MSLLDEEAYGDVDEFLERFGSDTPSLEQIRDLQVTAIRQHSSCRKPFLCSGCCALSLDPCVQCA
jgi:TPP-dependent indolepyruvate ferredoxin oxidoreductase alpha subunit